MILNIILIIIILIILSMLVLYKKINYEFLELTETNRKNIMNGKNMKKYIPFAQHFLLFKLLKIFISKMDNMNVRYFLSCGGLLGYFRHNKGLIPWDDDLDVCVFEEDRDKVQQICDEIIKENKDIILKTWPTSMNRLYISNSNVLSIFLDIFFYRYFEDEKYYFFNESSLRHRFNKEHITQEQLFPLKTVEYNLYSPDGSLFDKINIYIPNKSEEYLDNIYKNWRTEFVYNKPHSIYNIINFN